MTLRIPLAAAVLSLCASIAGAAPVPMPAGAAWMLVAPSPERLAAQVETTLGPAGELAPSLSRSRLSVQLQRRTGLPLLDRDALVASGVDPTQPWILFERGGAEYLAVAVRDRDALAGALDGWAARRGLQARAPLVVANPRGALAVTFSRTAGTRAATGYLIAQGRAVILVAPADRTPALAAAYDAVDSAAPVDPPVSGPLLFWVGTGVSFKDGWLAVRPRADGVDLVGSARRALPGWFQRDAVHASWISALTASPEGSGVGYPLWLRIAAGPKATARAVEAWTPLADPSDGALPLWLHGLAQLAPGPLEILARTVDVSPLSSQADLTGALLSMVRPEVLFVDRPAEAIAARLSAAASQLCRATADGDVVRGVCREGTLSAARRGSTLAVGWGDDQGGPAVPDAIPGAPGLSCGKGLPIAAGRIDLAAIYDGTKGIGLLDALSNDMMAALYALIAEYGAIMRVSRPVAALACVQPDGRLTLEARWRFRAP